MAGDPMAPAGDGGTPALALPGPELTIQHAAEARLALLAWLQAQPAGSTPLALDLAGVEDVDSAGVQLLVATGHSLAAQGRSLAITGAQAALRDALGRFGLHHLLAAAG